MVVYIQKKEGIASSIYRSRILKIGKISSEWYRNSVHWASTHFGWLCFSVHRSGRVSWFLWTVGQGPLTRVPGKPSIRATRLRPTFLGTHGSVFSCDTIMSINVCIYTYIWMHMCGSLCVFVDEWPKRGSYLRHS